MTPLSFTKLLKRPEFVRVASSGTKFVASSLVLQVAEGEQSSVRVGITATKTIGNAVLRNRAKRRLRAACREVLPTYAPKGKDYVLIARKNCVQCRYDSLLKDLISLLGKVKA